MGLSLLFSLSVNLFSQSPEKELDQVELLKQFIGTWELAISEDSLIVVTQTPFGDGLLFNQENKANGETYTSYIGLWGISSDKKTIEQVSMDEKGDIMSSVGKFVSTKKFVSEDNFDMPYGQRISEFEFESPETILYRIKFRGEDLSWESDWAYTFKVKKVK